MTTEPKKMSRSLLILNTVLTFPIITLTAAGNWRWLEGWLFAIWVDVMILFSMFYLYWKDPALLAERTKAPGSDNQKPWDKYLLVAIYFIAIATKNTRRKCAIA